MNSCPVDIVATQVSVAPTTGTLRQQLNEANARLQASDRAFLHLVKQFCDHTERIHGELSHSQHEVITLRAQLHERDETMDHKIQVAVDGLNRELKHVREQYHRLVVEKERKEATVAFLTEKVAALGLINTAILMENQKLRGGNASEEGVWVIASLVCPNIIYHSHFQWPVWLPALS